MTLTLQKRQLRKVDSRVLTALNVQWLCRYVQGYYYYIKRSLEETWLHISVCVAFVTSPTGAVAKYCNQHVRVSVCMRAYLPNYMHELYEFFCACCLWPWLSPPPASWRKPKAKGQFWQFSSPLTMHCMGRIALWILLQRT